MFQTIYRTVGSATGIFWQIFFWFWLSMLAVIIASTIVVLWSVNTAETVPEQRALYHELVTSGQKLIKEYRGSTAKIDWEELIQKASNNNNRHLYLINLIGGSMGEKFIPRALENFHEENYDSKIFQLDIVGNLVLVGPYQMYLGGHNYQLYLLKERPLLAWVRVIELLTQHTSLVISSILVSVLLCFLLSLRLVLPLRELQRVSRSLAYGNFSVRVKDRVSARFDEIGELGQDFNRMAMQLEELMVSKERLLRDVSHELRSPLTRLQLALALARNKVGGKVAEAEHNRIESEIERLNILIGRNITWSRLSTSPDKARTVIEFKAFMEALVADTDYEAQGRNVRVKLFKNDNTQAFGNSEMLKSAIENIIRNAIRFAPSETVIEVRQAAVTRHGKPWIVIRIRDYGPGVPEESLKSLFEPFYRVDATRGQENNGSGLGMAIARRMLDHHQGMISVENANPGLRVIIEFPVNLSKAARYKAGALIEEVY